MQMDWFTFIAQIVNFLILVALLRIFLYRPVLRIMDRRQENIAGRLEEAQELKRQAEEERESLKRERDLLESRQKDILDGARKEAEEQKEEMIQEERRHVEDLREKWLENLEREKDDFLDDLGRRVGEQVFEVSRVVLEEFTGSDLKEQVFARFLEKLESLGDEETDEIRSSLKENGSVRIISASELSGDQREELKKALEKITGGQAALDFGTDDSLVAGIEARLGGRRISWSIDRYLSGVREQFSEMISRGEQESGARKQAGSGGEGGDKTSGG